MEAPPRVPMLLTIAVALALLQAPQAPPRDAPFQPAPPPRSVAPPRLRIEPAGRVDLGSLGPQEPRERLYTLRNTSALPITLRVLDLSPGVTVRGPALQGPIDPGRAAELTLRVDPTGFTGWQARNAKLGTDDPGQGEYFLPVGMTIRPDLSVERAKLSLGEVGPHETPQAVFRFTSETGSATKLGIAGPLPPYLEAEVEAIPAAAAAEAAAAKAPPAPAGTRGALRLTLRPARLEPGMHAGLEAVTVETSSPAQPRFQLYLDWRLRLPVKLSAPRLVFLTAADQERTLTVLPREGQGSFEVKTLRLEGRGFRIPKVPAGPRTTLQVTVRRTAAAPAKAMLVLDLAGEARPLRIPVAYLPPVPGKPQVPRPDPAPPAGTPRPAH